MAASDAKEPKAGSQYRGWRFVLLVILLIAAPVITWVFRENPAVGLLVLTVHLMLGAALGSCATMGALLGPLLVWIFGSPPPPPLSRSDSATRFVLQVAVGVLAGFLIGLLLDGIAKRTSEHSETTDHANGCG